MTDELQQDQQVQLPEGVEAGKVAAYPIDLDTGQPVPLGIEARKQLADDFAAEPEATQAIVQDGDRTVEIGYDEEKGYFLLAEDVSGAAPGATEESNEPLKEPRLTGPDDFPTSAAPTNTHQSPAEVEPVEGPVPTSTSERISAPIGKRARRMAARERRREEFIAAQERKQAEERAVEDAVEEGTAEPTTED